MSDKDLEDKNDLRLRLCKDLLRIRLEIDKMKEGPGKGHLISRYVELLNLVYFKEKRDLKKAHVL